MRIGMILDKPFPPDPRVENEAMALINAGHSVYLFCLTYGEELFSEEINGIQVKRYISSTLEYKLSALAYTVPFYTNIMAKKIENFLIVHQIEAIHIHDMVIAEAVLKVNKKLKLPTTLDLHENRPEIMKLYPHLQKFPGKYLISPLKWKQKETSFIKKVDTVVVVTQEAKAEINKKNHSVVVVPNSVRKSFYEKANINENILKKYKDNFVILYLGDTGLRRGLQTAIKAVATLKNEIKNIKLVIVGSNATDSILKQQAKDLDIERFIDFEGWQDVSLFPSYIKASNIGISPLHKNKHHDTTYANKIFQYMSFSKPVLVSDAIAQKNLIKKTKSGLVYKEQDVGGFTNKVLKLYHNEELRNELGENGKKFIEEEFVWEKVSQNLVDLYAKLEIKN